MIKYDLICETCKKVFSSWFASFKEYEKIKKKKLLNCHHCGSFHVNKSLMAPNLNMSKKSNANKEKQYKYIKKKIKDYQNFIKNNFSYVGNHFTYEARQIHYEKKNNRKGIYGNATNNEINELKNEGIEVQTIPWINDKEN